MNDFASDRLILSALTGLFTRWSSRELQQESAEESGVVIDSTDLRAVYLLGMVGEPVRPSVLADELHLTRPTTSKLLARLSADGLIERQADEFDKRVNVVALTREGSEIFERLIATGIRMIRDATADWEAAEREHFQRSLTRFVAGMDIKTISGAESGREEQRRTP